MITRIAYAAESSNENRRLLELTQCFVWGL
jgi:hypothetical protein